MSRWSNSNLIVRQKCPTDPLKSLGSSLLGLPIIDIPSLCCSPLLAPAVGESVRPDYVNNTQSQNNVITKYITHKVVGCQVRYHGMFQCVLRRKGECRWWWWLPWIWEGGGGCCWYCCCYSCCRFHLFYYLQLPQFAHFEQPGEPMCFYNVWQNLEISQRFPAVFKGKQQLGRPLP